MFSMFGGRSDRTLLISSDEPLDLSSADAALFKNKLIVFLGATDLYDAFNACMSKAGVEPCGQTADPRIQVGDRYPLKKLSVATTEALGLMSSGFAAPTLSSGPNWMAFLPSAMLTATLYARRRKTLELQDIMNPPKGRDTDKLSMITDDDTGTGVWAHLVRLVQLPDAVPGLQIDVDNRIDTMLSWMNANAPGILPDAFVYNPYSYDDVTPWQSLEGNAYVPFVEAPYRPQVGMKVQDTVDALVKTFKAKRDQKLITKD